MLLFLCKYCIFLEKGIWYKVKWLSVAGATMILGFEKDLFLPFSQLIVFVCVCE